MAPVVVRVMNVMVVISVMNVMVVTPVVAAVVAAMVSALCSPHAADNADNNSDAAGQRQQHVEEDDRHNCLPVSIVLPIVVVVVEFERTGLLC